MEKLHLISGMPRSGSTLLCNLLNMNPKFHATATSPLIDVLSNIRASFSHNVTFKTNDRINQYENIQKGLKGFVNGFYYDKNVVFDKCRGWSNNINFLDNILQHENTKIIWIYRNPIDIINSIEKHNNRTILLENADQKNGIDFSTLKSRVDNLINDGGLVARPVWYLNDAIEMGYGNRILLIKYEDICKNTQKTLNKIHEFIGEDIYQYDKNEFKDLKQTTIEFDGLYNFKFPHTIKEGQVKYIKNDSRLPSHLEEKINQRFSWINDLAKKI